MLKGAPQPHKHLVDLGPGPLEVAAGGAQRHLGPLDLAGQRLAQERELAEGVVRGLGPQRRGQRLGDAAELADGVGQRRGGPLEAGLGWITKLDKSSFIGRDALLAQKAAGVPRRLVGLALTEAGVPRADYPVFAAERQVGTITSGTLSPSLRVGIALALVEPGCAAIGTSLAVGIRNRRVGAEVVKTPFVKKASN